MPPDLHEGATGEEVRAIQQALNIQPNLPGPPLENGVFDAPMTQRLIAYQTSKHIPATGIVDSATRLALYPYGVASVTILATRLTLPSLAAPALSSRIPHFAFQTLTPPTWAMPRLGSSWEPLPQLRWGPRMDAHADLRDHIGWSDPTRLSVDWTQYTNKFRLEAAEDPSQPCYEHVSIPNASVPLPIFSPLAIEPFKASPEVRGQFRVLGFKYDHTEVVPGGQSTFLYKTPRQDAFTLTMQMIYQRGKETITGGVQISAPLVGNVPNGAPWTFNPFVQLSDVDRFWKFGQFHLWQPYAQIGAQVQGPGDLHPTITGGLFPVNLGYDIGDVLTAQFTAGVPFAFDMQTHTASWGGQIGFGLALKLGDIWPVVKWGQ